jgi:hypothetical protein
VPAARIPGVSGAEASYRIQFTGGIMLEMLVLVFLLVAVNETAGVVKRERNHDRGSP